MRTIASAIGGALTVTFLWYFFNQWVNNAGIAFVRGQGWPLSTAWLMLAIGAIGGVVRDSLRRRGEVQQSSMAVTTADKLGLAYTPLVERPAARLPCFEHWSSGKDGNTGEICGVPVSVFDMTQCIPSSEGNSYPSRTVVLLPARGLPEFTATPRWLGGRFAHVLGFGAMSFDPSAAPANDAEVVRRFGRALRIEAPGDPGPTWEPATVEAQAREAAIRKLFTPALMAALLDHPGWSFQANDEWLACWRGNEVQPAGERPGLMADAAEIRTALLTAVADSPSVGLPPLPLPSPGQYAARLLGTLAGGVLGLFGGFFGGFFGGEEALGLKMFPIVPFLAAAVGGVTGGAFGFVIGAAIGRLPAVARWTPPPQDTPEQKAEKRRRTRWQQRFGCLGLFVGLFAGFAVFIALIEFFLQGNVQGGWMAMFPILCISGAIAGTVWGAAVGRRLDRRRKDFTEEQRSSFGHEGSVALKRSEPEA